MYANWRNLIRPKKLVVNEKTLTASYGSFIASPLEKGFGITLGNSLRRVLLSSLQGAAVTKVRFEKVLHEFATLPGVVEDVTDIILNLKQLKLKLSNVIEDKIVIDVKGAKEIKASDIQGSANIEVLNPDLHIATLNGDSFWVEMTVKTGSGYVTSEQNKSDDDSAGEIAIDSIFSPILKVNYNVTNARVEQSSDYDKLALQVWTDSSVSPDDAVAYAAKVLKEQLQLFINFDEVPEPVYQEEVVEEEVGPQINSNLYRRVDELELSVRSANCLQNADIAYIGELVQKSEQEMLKTKNFGRKSLNEIKEILVEMDLGLGMNIEGFELSDIEEYRKNEAAQDRG